MANILKQAWWTLLLRGAAALILALLLLFAPGVTLATGSLTFVILFGIYALVDGIAAIVGSVIQREGQWFLMLLLGIVGVITGILALANPVFFTIVSLRIMVFIVSFKAISGGIIEMISGWQLRREIDNEWMLIINGFFSLIFGLLLITRPIAALEVLVLIAAFYLLVAGVLQIILAFKVRGWSGKIETLKAT